MADEKNTPETKQNFNRDPWKVELAKALEHLRIMLSARMKELRIDKRDVRQQDVADKLDVNQSWISKVESSTQNTGIESILEYLKALDAEFVVGILDGEEFLPVSEAAEEWWDTFESAGESSGEDHKRLERERGRKISEIEDGFEQMLNETPDWNRGDDKQAKFAG